MKALPPIEEGCQACGVCCTGWDVPVHYEDDEERPPDKTPKYLTRSVRGRMGFASEAATIGVRRMQMVPAEKGIAGKACVALGGEPGCKTTCKVYDRRPRVCRNFAPGSEACWGARDTWEARFCEKPAA